MGNFRKLGRHAAHRVSMLRTMVSQLVKHERIETTVAKAKEVRRKADQMVQLGKDGTLDSARRASAFVRGDDVVHKLFTELAYRYKELFRLYINVPLLYRDRAGGYTRLLRTRIRIGDAAPMAYIEFVDRENELREAKPSTPQPPQRAPLDPWTRSRASQQWAGPKVSHNSGTEGL
ncbi:50S ribosomal protein L17-like [Lolium rigidum]|uniref:50S ribosomal protein L17-like n=1 Tax=Lolium rigidum TaxID=89674 RepID=UPI001F5CC66A|nr:50S ribosomal protein L17-like [Lolium rigidum]